MSLLQSLLELEASGFPVLRIGIPAERMADIGRAVDALPAADRARLAGTSFVPYTRGDRRPHEATVVFSAGAMSSPLASSLMEESCRKVCGVSPTGVASLIDASAIVYDGPDYASVQTMTSTDGYADAASEASL